MTPNPKGEFRDVKMNYFTGSNHSSEDTNYLNLCLNRNANYLEKHSEKNCVISHLRSTWNGRPWSNWLSHEIIVISRRAGCYIGVRSPGPRVSTPAGHHSLFRLRQERNFSCWHNANSTVSAKHRRCSKTGRHKVLRLMLELQVYIPWEHIPK